MSNPGFVSFPIKKQQDWKTPNYQSPGCEFWKNCNKHKEGPRPEKLPKYAL